VRETVGLVKRVMAGIKRHNLSLVAAGVAYYSLLAIFPAMIAVVAIYGLVATPAQIKQQLEPVVGQLPPGAGELLTTQLTSAAEFDRSGLTLGVLISLGATIWAAAGGVRALCRGLSMIWEQEENRGFVNRATTALALTIAAMIAVMIALALVAAFPVVLGRIGLGSFATGAAQAARWLLLILLLGIGLAVLYRWGPAGERPRWRWISWGTSVALLVWILGSVGFSVYVANFSSYNKTYGSLAAVIVLMLWLYLSAFAVLLGAEVDASRQQEPAKV
jgi:membrane protein